MSGTRTMALSLRPQPVEDPEKESIKYMLQRINEERGGFRHITEEGLKEEIRAREAGEVSSGEEDVDDGEAATKEKEPKSRREELYAARGEMLQHILSAQNEALTALDFVSLLLSRDSPNQAAMSMSPYLKQNAPPGSLGVDSWHGKQPDRTQERNDDLLAKGLRMQSLQASADSLLGAASRLEKNIKRETEYWNQVLSVSEQGWSICRMPRERHNLGVRFGFSEALPQFKERGLAALRADEDGNVLLSQGLAHRPKVVRVRMRENGQVTGTSTTSRLADESETTLESRIRRARDSLFDEELFHEMVRESRTIASYGVKVKDSTIYLPTRPTHQKRSEDATMVQEVLIDLVVLDKVPDEPRLTQQDGFAQTISLALRLLLSHAHRQKLKQRSQPPPPFSAAKREVPVQLILRPTLTFLRHLTALAEVDAHLERLRSLLASAGIASRLTPAKPTLSNLHAISTMEGLLALATEPWKAQARLSIHHPSSNESHTFTCDLETLVAPPTFGTEITLTAPPPIPPSTSTRFSLFAELVSHLERAVPQTLALAVAERLRWEFAPDDAA
ncbi:RNA polymerase II mediator complex subunit, partial [Elasticomyces elasticus]